MKTVGITLVTGCVLSGCGYFTPPMEHPSFEQHVQGRVNTFGVIPSRRMMIFKSGDPEKPSEPPRILLCAEAPADVTDSLAGTLAASLAVSGAKQVDVSGALSKTLQTFGQSLFKRTQGIQMFRDRSYYLCQARMNGFINNEQYIEKLDAAYKEAIVLIKEELSRQPKVETEQKPIPPAPAVSTSGNPKIELTVTPNPATASTEKTTATAGKEGASAKAGAAETKAGK